MAYENLRTVRQVAEANPAFSENGLRWLLFNREANGFNSVVVKVGRRVLLDVTKLDEWIENQRCVYGGERRAAR